IPGRGVHGEPVPDPIYGDQIQGNAVPGVPREADVIAEYETVTGKFQSGETYTLRRPKYRLEHLGFGAVAEGLLMSARVAPPVIAAENHTAREPPCDTQPSGGSPEASDLVLRSVAGYARTLGVPARRRAKDGTDRRGEDLFERVRCPACHVPSFGTGPVPDLP